MESNVQWTCRVCATGNTNTRYVCDVCRAKHTLRNYKTSEETLSVIAKVVLWIGIATCVIFTLGGIESLTDHNGIMGFSLITSGLFVLISSIVTRAALKVLCNISNNLREINQKTK